MRGGTHGVYTCKNFTAFLSPKDLGLLGSQNSKDAGDGFSSSKPYSLGQPFTCRKRNRQIWIQAAMNNYSSIPENHTGTTLLIQSSEWGTLAHTFRYEDSSLLLTPTPREPECHFYFCENPIGI